MFEKPKKKIIKKNGSKLLLDFDKLVIKEPNSNDMEIVPKLKEVIKKPTTKKKPPKKGKSLF